MHRRDYKLKVAQGLFENAVYAFVNEGERVVYGHNNANKGLRRQFHWGYYEACLRQEFNIVVRFSIGFSLRRTSPFSRLTDGESRSSMANASGPNVLNRRLMRTLYPHLKQ